MAVRRIMTLVLGISSFEFTAMASDRLVTLVDPGSGRYRDDYDPLANKTLVLLTSDAIVSVGYCGSAYVAGKATDNWIAETAAPGVLGRDGEPGMFGGKTPSRLKLHQVCNRLRKGLASSQGGHGVTVMMVGWRIRRGKCAPIHLVFGASSDLGRLPGLLMRPAWPFEAKFGYIGAQVSRREMHDALLNTRGNVLLDRDKAVQFFTTLIREKAKVDRTVGSHVMTVVIPHPDARRVLCCFDPSEGHYQEREVNGAKSRQLVAYSPWILTPGTFYAPTEATGEPGSGSEWQADGWIFEMTDVARAAATPSNTGWARPQERKPRPGSPRPRA